MLAADQRSALARPGTRGSSSASSGASAARQRASSKGAQSVPGHVGERLRVNADGGGEHGHVAGERLEHGQPEALALGGHEHGVGGVDEQRHARGLDAAEREQLGAGRRASSTARS